MHNVVTVKAISDVIISLCSINMQHESQEKLLDGISKMEKIQSLR